MKAPGPPPIIPILSFVAKGSGLDEQQYIHIEGNIEADLCAPIIFFPFASQ
jgi:hypothetical protein